MNLNVEITVKMNNGYSFFVVWPPMAQVLEALSLIWLCGRGAALACGVSCTVTNYGDSDMMNELMLI